MKNMPAENKFDTQHVNLSEGKHELSTSRMAKKKSFIDMINQVKKKGQRFNDSSPRPENTQEGIHESSLSQGIKMQSNSYKLGAVANITM